MKLARFAAIVLAATAVACQATDAQEPVKLETEEQKISYAVGADVFKMLTQQGIEVDPVIFARGFADAAAGKEMLLSEEDMRASISGMQQELVARQQEMQEMMQQAAGVNLEGGQAFLEENKGKPGVVTLESGLQYKVLQEGSGATPLDGDTVTVNYTGTFIDGREFDSSIRRGQPASFPINAVIPGWTEALKLMKVGSKWQIFIPPSLGYGERGAGGVIPPNATLVFEVELLGIQEKQAATTPR